MKKENVIIVLAVILSLCVGYLLGSKLNTKESLYHQMPDGSLMQNTMHDMTNNLTNKTGADLEKAFLKEMIVHHEGAVEMAEILLRDTKRPELIKLSNDIVSAQTKEIEMMKVWLNTWFR